MTMLSVFGSSGFIGSRYSELYASEAIQIKRDVNRPATPELLYLISTVDNYNVYTDPYLDINTNLIKLVDVLEECRKIEDKDSVVFNFISSWFVYGKTNDFPANEDSVCNPKGFYSITKYAAENMLASYCNTYGIKYRILRLTNIIGKHDKKISKKKNAIQFMIERLKRNEDVELYSSGNVVRDYMFVDDCCRAINMCVKTAPYNEIINISNSEPIEIKEIIEYAKAKIGSSSRLKSIDTPAFHSKVQIANMYLDNTKLLKLGYKPSMTVYDAIDEILEITND
jgi:nucleoside-diphosphate-sugar epimerase